MADFIQDELSFTTDANGVTTATLKIRTASGSVACSPLTIAVRDFSGNNLDFTGQNVTVTPTQQTFTFTKTLPTGSYYAWASYYYAPQSTWYNVFRQSVDITNNGGGGGSGGPGTRLGKSNVFYDDFAATIDTTKWRVNNTSAFPSNGPKNPGDHKVDYFHTGQVASSGGNCVFTAQDAGFTITGFPQGGTKEAWYTAFLTTEGVTGGFQVQTGDYLEGRFLLPSHNGAWPALWTWKNGGNEVDVFEYHPDNPNLLELGNHLGAGSSYYYTNSSNVAPGQWVTIGALLGQSAVAWYVNGTNVYTDSVGVGSGWTSNINLNLSLSDGYYHPQPTGSAFTFTTDYVGVWR